MPIQVQTALVKQNTQDSRDQGPLRKATSFSLATPRRYLQVGYLGSDVITASQGQGNESSEGLEKAGATYGASRLSLPVPALKDKLAASIVSMESFQSEITPLRDESAKSILGPKDSGDEMAQLKAKLATITSAEKAAEKRSAELDQQVQDAKAASSADQEELVRLKKEVVALEAKGRASQEALERATAQLKKAEDAANAERAALKSDLQEVNRAYADLNAELLIERDERQRYQVLLAALRDGIRVMIRVKPPQPGASAPGPGLWTSPNRRALVVTPNGSNDKERKAFASDRVFLPNNNNADVFKEILPLVRLAATEGTQALVMMYGASGTGKSFTMRGNDADHGLVRLAASQLFRIAPAQATVDVSCFYIYGNEVRDLLARPLKVLEIPPLQPAVIPNAAHHEALTGEDIVSIFDTAVQKAITAATKVNQTSSRGHTFFNIRIRNGEGDNKGQHGLLTFVDLAGNEKSKKSGVEGQQFQEAQLINSSLFQLSQMIGNIRSGNVPDTKRCKLTQIIAGLMNFKKEGEVKPEALLLATVDFSKEEIFTSLSTLESVKKVCNPSAII